MTTTKSEVAARVRALYDRCMEVLTKGQAEYASGTDNAFANFERIGKELGLSREKVLLVFARKHWDGIIAHVNGHEAQREDVTGRIEDLVAYLGLLYAMCRNTNMLVGANTTISQILNNLKDLVSPDLRREYVRSLVEVGVLSRYPVAGVQENSDIVDSWGFQCGDTYIKGGVDSVGNLYILSEEYVHP